MFKPKVVQLPRKPGRYAVRKLTLRGWRYLHLWNYVTWHERSSIIFDDSCTADLHRANMAELIVRDKPPF